MRRHLSSDEWADERAEIFGLYQQLGIQEESERHRIQHAITGCPSLRYMSHEEHQKLIETLEQLLESPNPKRILEGLLALGSFDYQESSPF